MHRPARTAVAVLTATVLIAACGSTDDEAPPAAPAPEAAPAVTTATAPVVPATAAATTGPATSAASAPAALQFTAPLVGGGEIDLAGHAGQPVLFWFWAPY